MEDAHPGRMRASVLVAQGRFGGGPGNDGDDGDVTNTTVCSNDDADVNHDDDDVNQRTTTEETVKGMMRDDDEGAWERNALNTPAGFRANMEV